MHLPNPTTSPTTSAEEIKLIEAWKSQNIANYPFKLEPHNPRRNDGGRTVRAATIKERKYNSKTKAASESISRYCAKLWNSAPVKITTAPTLIGAKILIKTYCRTL